MDAQAALTLFTTYLSVERRSSQCTVKAYRTDISQFLFYLDHCDTFECSFLEIDDRVIRSWMVCLVKRGLSNRSINRKVIAVRVFYTFLCKQGIVGDVLSLSSLKSLKCTKRLPVFFHKGALLDFFNRDIFEHSFEGLRARLILELLYGTGMRLGELVSLCVANISLTCGTVRILGKGNKERVVPFPSVLQQLIKNYLDAKQAQGYGHVPQLIVTDRGKPVYPMFINRVVKRYLAPFVQSSQYSPHVLRHTFATHLLDNGADLQAIKELLGHASLATTQVYTHNSLSKLKEVFKKAHPRAEES